MEVTTAKKSMVCSVCGESSEHNIITNSAVSGAPDLDLRPSEPHRSSIKYWIMECPSCGYCNSGIDKSVGSDKDYLSSDEYKELGGISTDSALAARFIRKALICEKAALHAESVQSYLYAAWVLDDEGDEADAGACRKSAVTVMDNNPAVFENNDDFDILKADMLRRSGQFDRVCEEYSGKKYSKPLYAAIAYYQVSLSLKKDSAVHRADEIPGVAVKK